MQKLTKKSALLGAGGAFALLGSVTGLALAQNQNEKDAEVGVPAATMVRAINAAVAAKAGDVTKVEAETETEGGKTMVDVEVLAKDGKTYEVGVEAASGKVVSVEMDTENEAGENEAGEKDEAGDKD